MSTTIETLVNFDQITDHYLNELNNFSLEQLLLKPSANEWSLGQMYVHLFSAALYYQLRNVEKLRVQVKSVNSTGEKSEFGKTLFADGQYPPIRFHITPSPNYTPKQPESKEQIIEGLHAARNRMKEIEPSLGGIPTHLTISHPEIGALNAIEWYTHVDMHYRHHLHQKDRLKFFIEGYNRII